MWSCASWRPTTRTTWRCRSTSPCCSPSAATVASPSCGSRESGGSSSCWEPRMPTETRRSSETSTACWLRWVDSVSRTAALSYVTARPQWECNLADYFHAMVEMLLHTFGWSDFTFWNFSKQFPCCKTFKQTNSTEAWTWIWCVWFPRTPRLITAGYRRWGPTARRADAWTSGCPSWSCRSAEGARHPHAWTEKNKTNGSFLGSDTHESSLLVRGIAWRGLDCPGLFLTGDRQEPKDSVTCDKVRAETGSRNLLCAKDTNRKSDSHCQLKQTTRSELLFLRFRSGVTINQRSSGVRENAPTPQPGIPVWFSTDPTGMPRWNYAQHSCVFRHGRVLGEERCVFECVVCGAQCTRLSLE